MPTSSFKFMSKVFVRFPSLKLSAKSTLLFNPLAIKALINIPSKIAIINPLNVITNIIIADLTNKFLLVRLVNLALSLLIIIKF